MAETPEVRGFAPFVQIPKWLFTMGAYPVAVYGALASYADENGGCFPSVATLAARAGVGVTTCKRILRELEQAEAISITRRRRGDGGATSSVYDITPAFAHRPPSRETASPPPRDGYEREPRERHPLSGAEAPDAVSDEPSIFEDQDLAVATNGNAGAARTRAREERPDIDRVCSALADHVEEQCGRRPFVLGPLMGTPIRLMLDRDLPAVGVEDPEAEALRIIAWLRGPGGARFWAANILSAKKLRAQMPRLRAEAGRPVGVDTSLAARQERAARAISELQAQGR